MLDLELEHDRDEMLAALWGTPEQREDLASQLGSPIGGVGRRVAVSGAVGGIAAVTWSLLTEGSGVIGTFVFGFVGAIAGAMFPIPRIGALVPTPAGPLPALPRFAAGRLLSSTTIEAPASAETCAAWAIELRFEAARFTRHTLRIGESAGCEVELDGGERVRIPAGPLWIDGNLIQIDAEPDAVDDLLDDLDPQRRANDHFPLFPHNVVLEQRLHHGDRVELLGELERVPDKHAADELYREAAPSILQPRGLPVLRSV